MDVQLVPPPVAFDGFDQEARNAAGELEAQVDLRDGVENIDDVINADFFVPGRGAIRRMQIAGTPLDGPMPRYDTSGYGTRRCSTLRVWGPKSRAISRGC